MLEDPYPYEVQTALLDLGQIPILAYSTSLISAFFLQYSSRYLLIRHYSDLHILVNKCTPE